MPHEACLGDPDADPASGAFGFGRCARARSRAAACAYIDAMTTWYIADGYRFGATACGIRADEPDRLDLALILSDRPAAAAGAFTQNRVCAGPVQVCRERLPA